MPTNEKKWMFDATLLNIYLKSWAGESIFCTPQHSENRVRVERKYVDFGPFYDLSWRIEDLRETDRRFEPLKFEIRCSAPQLRKEVERVEREVITPQVHALLTQMQ